jgi:hypothetical protein
MRNSVMLALACLAVWGCSQTTASPPRSLPRYQIQPDKDGGVWRLDTSSGDVSYCWFAAGGTNVGCRPIAEPAVVPGLGLK